MLFGNCLFFESFLGALASLFFRSYVFLTVSGKILGRKILRVWKSVGKLIAGIFMGRMNENQQYVPATQLKGYRESPQIRELGWAAGSGA